MLFGAYALGLYANFTRTFLFLMPVLIISAMMGIDGLARVRWRAAPVLAGLTLACVLVLPVVSTARGLDAPGARDEIKPVLAHVRDNWRPGDVLYLYYTSQYAFLYYLRCDCFDMTPPGPDSRPIWRVVPRMGGRDQWARAFDPLGDDIRVGAYAGDDTADYLRQLDSIGRHPRVWILYSGNPIEAPFLEGDFVSHLDARGKRLDELAAPGSHVYLYDLSRARGSENARSPQG